jgi:demethylmenaquinone methyltransferase/2-methoxy-6-polyprenyl-1,4-benzoquinol methylase
MIARVSWAADGARYGETDLIRLRTRDGRNPQELAAMDLDVHLGDKVQKTKYVSTMFDIIAPGYDKFTRVFSFGMDKNWKAALVEEAIKRARKRPAILDLACGTGDFGIELARRMGASRAIGLDLSPQMLVEAKKRVEQEQSILNLAACDMLSLCVNDKSVDVVSIGYGLRNTADVGMALREIARVLKPGGILVNLDFHRPVGSVWRELFLWYMGGLPDGSGTVNLKPTDICPGPSDGISRFQSSKSNWRKRVSLWSGENRSSAGQSGCTWLDG